MCAELKAHLNTPQITFDKWNKCLWNVSLASLVLDACLPYSEVGGLEGQQQVCLCVLVCVGAHWNTASVFMPACTSAFLCVFLVGKGVLSLPHERLLRSQALDMLNSHMNVDKSISAPSKPSSPFLLAWEAEVKGNRVGRGEVDKSWHCCEKSSADPESRSRSK